MRCNVPGCRGQVEQGPLVCDEHLSKITPETREAMDLSTSTGKAAAYTAMAQIATAEGKPAGSWLAAAQRWANAAAAEERRRQAEEPPRDP